MIKQDKKQAFKIVHIFLLSRSFSYFFTSNYSIYRLILSIR